MARKSFNPGTLLVPLPAVMVTVGDMEKSNIITIGWTGILSTDPPRTYISVRPSRYSHKLLSENPEFVINLTTEDLVFATDYAGIYTGAKVDKFEKLSLTKIPSEKVKAPTIAESPLALECRVFDVLHSGTHDVFMADIVGVTVREELLDEKGKICVERAGLMTYAHGEYYSIGEKIGKFGFSAVKQKSPAGKKTAKRAAPSDTEHTGAKPKVKTANPVRKAGKNSHGAHKTKPYSKGKGKNTSAKKRTAIKKNTKGDKV